MQNQSKITTFLKNTKLLWSIVAVLWFWIGTYAFTWPPVWCTPESCNKPLTQDYVNQRVGIATDNPQVTLDVNGGMRIGRMTTAEIEAKTCMGSNLGTLVFDTDEDVMKVCKSTGWAVNTNGSQSVSTYQNIEIHFDNSNWVGINEVFIYDNESTDLFDALSLGVAWSPSNTLVSIDPGEFTSDSDYSDAGILNDTNNTNPHWSDAQMSNLKVFAKLGTASELDKIRFSIRNTAFYGVPSITIIADWESIVVEQVPVKISEYDANNWLYELNF